MQKYMINMLGATCAVLSLCACKPGIYYPFGATKNPQQIQAKQDRAMAQAYVNSHAQDHSCLVPVDANGKQTIKPTPNHVNSIIAS